MADHRRVNLAQVQAVIWVRRHLEMLSMGVLLQAMYLHREMLHRWQMGLMDLLQEMGRLSEMDHRQEMNLLQEN